MTKSKVCYCKGEKVCNL